MRVSHPSQPEMMELRANEILAAAYRASGNRTVDSVSRYIAWLMCAKMAQYSPYLFLNTTNCHDKKPVKMSRSSVQP